jgi:hypothetical protein
LKIRKYIPLLLAVLSVNLLGIIIRIVDLSPFFILLGFRFHIVLVIPFLFIIHRLKGGDIKQEFANPYYKRFYPFLISILLVPGVIITILYLLGYITLNDPDYFYEFGLSSVFDLPVYLIWNLPQLLLFFFFLKYASDIGLNYFMLLLLTFTLFASYFVPVDNTHFDLITASAFLFTSAAACILFVKYRNIYWFSIIIFLMPWIYFVLFGSSNSELIRILYASQYTSWEGFLKTADQSDVYAYNSYAALIFVSLLILSFRNKSFSK